MTIETTPRPDLESSRADIFSSLARRVRAGDAEAVRSAMRKVGGFPGLWDRFCRDPKAEGEALDEWLDLVMTLSDRLRGGQDRAA